MRIALVGNPNCGKTTLFNILTGMNAKIGNWPGVTIEKKTGKIINTDYEIIDLPGIYSLSPYSEEEELSRKFIFDENVDVIINIVDSTIIERSLYLTTQLLELNCRTIVALNMTDILEKKGLKIDEKKLEKILHTKVIKISALKGTGISELIDEIGKNSFIDKLFIYDSIIEYAINEIEKCLPTHIKHSRFVAVKLLEGDERFKELNTNKITNIVKEISRNYETDLEETIATQRYQFIEQVKKETVQIKKIIRQISVTDKLDKILLNKWIAFPIFIVIIFFIYYISIGIVKNITSDTIHNAIYEIKDFIKTNLQSIGVSEWLNSLIVDGIIVGVGAVIEFVPQLIILFFCISILETTGYMSRIALILDKIFRKIGLSGKSLIPFILGSGCSVSGIVGTKIIENNNQKEMTTILTPFIPCSAKLPIIALFSGYFFPNNSGIISVSLYFLSIFIIIISAIIMKKFIYTNTNNTYIFELPEYKIPSIKYVIKDVSDKVKSFLKRAGTTILICSIILWFLLSFSYKLEYGVNIEQSILASIGKAISWVFIPILGTNSWGATVSAIQGLVAKEQVISSMSVIAGISGDIEGNQIFSNGSMFDFFTASSAYAFMVFNLFSAPCFGAISAMEKELGSSEKMLKAITFQTILAWCLATAIHYIGTQIERGNFNFVNFPIIIIIICIVIFSIYNKKYSSCRYCNLCNKQKIKT